MTPRNSVLWKCTQSYKFTRTQDNIKYFLCKDNNNKIFAKKEKEQKTLIKTIRIYIHENKNETYYWKVHHTDNEKNKKEKQWKEQNYWIRNVSRLRGKKILKLLGILNLDNVKKEFGSVGWYHRTHRLHLFRGVRLSQRVSWNDTKQSDDETPVMLEFWGMWSTHSLPLLPDPLWPGG